MEIVHVYPFYNRLGGVEKYLLDTLPLQVKLGRSIRLVGAEFDHDVKRAYTCEKVPYFIRFPRALTSFVFAIAAEVTLRRLRNNRGRVMLVHSEGASCLSPDIVTAHSVHKAWFTRSLRELKPFTWPWWRKLLNPVHHLTIFIETIQYRFQKNTHVIAISDSIRRELHEFYGISDKRISVIHSGVDCEKYTPEKKDVYRGPIRGRLGLNDSDIVLLFVANEFRRKGLNCLISALKTLTAPNLKLVVLGKDNPVPYKELVLGLGLQDQVIFAGATPDVDQYYAAADIFVFPTTYEPFGLVATEALAAGLPVITSKLAGASEIMTHGEDSLLVNDPNSSEELALALKTLLDSNTRNRMGQRARQTALANRWDAVVGKIESVYLELESKNQASV